MSNDHIDHDAVTREAAYTLASQHDIDLFRVIRRSGRKDRDKAKAVSLYLAETIIAEAAAMRERAAAVCATYPASRIAADLAAAIRALPATGEVE